MADLTLANAQKVVDAFNIPYLGYKFTLLAFPMFDQFRTVPFLDPVRSSDVFDFIGLSALGVSEVTLPTINANVREVPSLSNKPKYIPFRLSYSELILKAPSFRNRAFWDLTEKQLLAFKDPKDYFLVHNNILLVEFDINNASVVELLPIASWLLTGTQMTSYTPASSNTNSTVIPLEELRLQIDDLKRII